MSQEFNILVVEDEIVAQTVVKFILEELGCQVQIAENGTQALAMFQAATYDLIFMDLGLPDISGIEVTKKIRNLEQNLSHIPIVGLTANFDPKCKNIVLEAGMDEFLNKPLTKETANLILTIFLSELV